jgi:DHA1 family tetracycline resistance protein-like MFS transporter
MHTKHALAFIFCAVTLDGLAVGLVIPVLPKLVLEFMGSDTAAAARVFGVFATAWGLMQFFSSPILGALSDRFGRRPVLLISSLGLGLDYIFMAVAPSLTLLFIGRLVSGSAAATFSTAFAYVADVTPSDRRAKAFGGVGMAFGFGFIVGPALGGLLSEVAPRLPFWVSAAACLVNAAFGWFVLPESLPPERRMAFAWKRANPVGSLRLLLSHRQLTGLAAADFLANVAHNVLPSVFVLYAAYRYGWSELTVGLTLAFVGVCSAIVQGLLVGPTIARIGARYALVLGLAAGGLGMAVFGLAPTGPWFWLGVPIMALWGLAGPASQEMMTRLVSPSERGQLQGANSSSRSLTALLAPSLFTGIFAWLLAWLPGAPFLLAMALLFAAAGVGWLVTKPSPDAAQPA